MTLKQQLADHLKAVSDARDESLAQLAQSLGYTRQRFHQLRTADRTAAPEAIAEALEKLGYKVIVTIEKQDS